MIARVRANVVLLAFALVAPLLGASSGFGPPIVVVYPITSSGGLPASVGGDIALVFATKLTQLGGITVKPATPGTARAQFLDAALASGADYYITGFLTPIGRDSSLIAQVVSTHSGSVVFSTSAVVRTFADAQAQVDALHAAILRHAGRGLAALDAPPPAPSSSPSAGPNDGSKLDIGKALRKRKRSAPTATAGPPPPPSPSPAPTSNAPSPNARPSAAATRTSMRTPVPNPGPTQTALPTANIANTVARPVALLFVVDGALAPSDVADTMRALADGFARAKRPTSLLSEPLGTSLSRATAICAAHPGTNELDAATLVEGTDEDGAPRVQLDLTAYDCNGARLRTSRALATGRGRSGLHDAIVRAANTATAALARP